MTKNGDKTAYAVLGHPIGHSLSPIMHSASFRSLGLNATYVALDVAPEVLMAKLPELHRQGYNGLNLTVPLKEVAFNGLTQLDESASAMGAVNTVQFLDDGTMKGFNTDGIGFLKAIKEDLDCEISGKKVFILGGGGAGRAVALTSAMNGASYIAVADVDKDRTNKLCAEISRIAPGIDVETLDVDPNNIQTASLNADLIVQATPVGMKPEDTPLLSSSAFREGQMLFDLIYMYPETGIMKNAAQAGVKTANGLGMLLHQGAHAFKIWTGIDADTAAMREALEMEVYKDD